MPRRINLSAYRFMWLLAMFDLPVETAENKRDYVRFRKALKSDAPPDACASCGLRWSL